MTGFFPGRPKTVSAQSGYDGRLSPAPGGGVYVRDPAEARAKAIRDRVALLKGLGQPIPDHLQSLFDALPPLKPGAEDSVVELVDEKTGEVKADVKVIPPGETEDGQYGTIEDKTEKTTAPPDDIDALLNDTPEPLDVEVVPEAEPDEEDEDVEEAEPEPEPEPVVVKQSASAAQAIKRAADAQAAAQSAQGAGTLSAQAATGPAVVATVRPRGRPRKAGTITKG